MRVTEKQGKGERIYRWKRETGDEYIGDDGDNGSGDGGGNGAILYIQK